jgi:single stranded DNA-binding protein
LGTRGVPPLWSRISYGAQELAVFLLDHSPLLICPSGKGRKKQVFFFFPLLYCSGREDTGEEVMKHMAKSLNRVQLIGNLTRDPELRYTEKGTPVCAFGLATNRTVTTATGEKSEETDFHRIVAWRKLAELCDQYLTKGRKVYVSGRLQTRRFTGQDGTQKSVTEIVIADLILLDRTSDVHRKQEVRLHV